MPRVIVQVKTGSIALSLPLIAAKQLKKALHPTYQLVAGVVGKTQVHFLKHFLRGTLVADSRLFHGVQNIIGHQVVFVGLLGGLGAQLGGGLLLVDKPKGGQGHLGVEAFFFGPYEPLPQKVKTNNCTRIPLTRAFGQNLLGMK